MIALPMSMVTELPCKYIQYLGGSNRGLEGQVRSAESSGGVVVLKFADESAQECADAISRWRIDYPRLVERALFGGVVAVFAQSWTTHKEFEAMGRALVFARVAALVVPLVSCAACQLYAAQAAQRDGVLRGVFTQDLVARRWVEARAHALMLATMPQVRSLDWL